MKESYLWSQVKAALDGHAHACRIENTAGTGISDVNLCWPGGECWVELKVFKGKRLHFRNSQLNWIMTRSRFGGTVWVLARDGDEIWLYPGDDLLQNCERRPEGNGSFSIVPDPLYATWWHMKPFNWAELREILLKPVVQSVTT